MVFTSKEKVVLCVGVCSNKLRQDCAACVCEKVLQEVINSKADLEREKEIQRQRLPVQSKRIWTSSNSKRERRADLPNTLANPQKIYKKNKYGGHDISHNSLTGSKETFGNETLQTAGRSGLKRSSQAKAQIILC